MLIVNLVACVLFGAALLSIVRWIGRQSPLLGAIMAAGLLVRAMVGLALFWISYLKLPLLSSLQMGDGFWILMLDARNYYQMASTAAEHGLATIDVTSPSPFFTRTLALWMRVVGVSPAAGMFLNLCLYVFVCGSLVRLCRPVGRWSMDLPLVTVITMLSLSPVLVVDATQPLKDDVFLALIVCLCVAVLFLFREITVKAAPRRALPVAMVGCVLAAAVYGTAGMRSYYPVIVVGCLAFVLFGLTVVGERGARVRRGVGSVLTLLLVWTAYWAGAGPYYRPSAEERKLIADSLPWNSDEANVGNVLAALTTPIKTARSGFIWSGGQTNTVQSQTAGDADAASTNARLAIGLAVLFVPVSLLKAASVIDFTGGQGLFSVADVDILLIDSSLLILGWTLFRRRRVMASDSAMAFVAFAILLAGVTAVLLGYVVTNVGTLVRMRYLVAAPLWTLVLVASLPRSTDPHGPARRMSESF